MVSQNEVLRVFPLSWLFLGLRRIWVSAQPEREDIIAHSDSPNDCTLVFPSAGKVFTVVAPLNVPYLIGMYFQDCGCDVRETRRIAMVISVQGKGKGVCR